MAQLGKMTLAIEAIHRPVIARPIRPGKQQGEIVGIHHFFYSNDDLEPCAVMEDQHGALWALALTDWSYKFTDHKCAEILSNQAKDD